MNIHSNTTRRSFFVRYLPVFTWISYHIVILIITFYGPIYWDIQNPWHLIRFILFSNLSFLFGYIAGRAVRPRAVSHDPLPAMYKIGAALTVLLLLPNMYIYTGKGLTDLSAAVADQGAAWKQTQDQIVSTSGSRTWFAFLRGILAPFTLCVVPLFFLKWRDLSTSLRIAGLATLLSIITFSLARGTDKETMELGLFLAIGTFLSFFRAKKTEKKLSFRKILFISVLVFSGITLSLNLFLDRKNARIGDIDVFCQSVTTECADYNNFFLSWMSDENKGSGAIIVNYLSQGMYGLSRALEMPFDSTYLIGHSAFIMAQVERYAGPDNELLSRSFIGKLDRDGWPRKTSWSSTYTWIANDVGFSGVFIVMIIFGFASSVAWRDFIYMNNDLAYLIIICFAITLFYIPANFQIPQTIDYYFPAIVWTFLWIATRGATRNRQI